MKNSSSALVGFLGFLLALPPAFLLPSSALARDSGETLRTTTTSGGNVILARGGDGHRGDDHFWGDHRGRGHDRFWDDHRRRGHDRFWDDHRRRDDRHDRFFRERHNDDFYFGYDRRYRDRFPSYYYRSPRDHFRYDRNFPDYSVCFRSGSTLICVR